VPGFRIFADAKTQNCAGDHILLANLDYKRQRRKLWYGEVVMSTITTTTFWATHASRWDQLKLRISEWQRRTRSRRELDGLSDATLRDIGITRCDAHREMNKPFWMA
jgi:uncharacterized protein YjiS (DUF1127 family)